MLSFWFELLSRLMKIDLLRAKRQGLSSITKSNGFHTQYPCIKSRGDVEVFDGQHQMIKAVNFHEMVI